MTDDEAFQHIEQAFAAQGVKLEGRKLYEDIAQHATGKCSTAIADAAMLMKTKGEAIIVMSMIAMEIFAGTMSFVTLHTDNADNAKAAIDDFAEVCREYAHQSRVNRQTRAMTAVAAARAAEA